MRVVCSMECAESEKAAVEKRDVVKAKVEEVNGKLSQLNEQKKEKMKDAKKTRKYVLCHWPLAPCGLRGCKNGPAPFPGRMSYKATKPGLVCLSYLSMLHYCIVVY